MLTVPEAARRAGRNPETIRRWIREGKLPASKAGTQHLIDPAALDAKLGGAGALATQADADRIEAVAPLMPSSAADDWLPAMVGRIVRLVDPVRIVLFGSRARGATGPDSDYDLLVVLDTVESRRRSAVAIRRSLADLPIAKDVVVATQTDLEPGPTRPRGIIDWAVETGRTIYER